MVSPDSAKWLEAMKSEMGSMYENKILNTHHNGFTYIPDDFFKGLTALKEVYLDHNPFAAWPFPAGLADCVSLTNFSANSVNRDAPGLPRLDAVPPAAQSGNQLAVRARAAVSRRRDVP
ncbi:hypothetical protein TRIUR3_26230 [Triticum urartu]|uniref:Uncharacterized protein n=1 Tax=Triticum urartu TaxID=4572 RepID=M7ZJD5_TRIUA|nr:hypothetical protein TRIUR3_26230 [Triticum urartu]